MMPKNWVAKEIRHYAGSLFIFLFVIGIIVTLLQFPVLDSNMEVVMMLIGTIAASIPIIISSITGTKTDDVEAMKAKVEKLELTIEQLHKNKDEYEKMIINLQNQMVENYDNILDRIILKSAMDFDDKRNKLWKKK